MNKYKMVVESHYMVVRKVTYIVSASDTEGALAEFKMACPAPVEIFEVKKDQKTLEPVIEKIAPNA